MVDMPLGFDRYDGFQKGGRRLDLLRRPGVPNGDVIVDRRVRIMKN